MRVFILIALCLTLFSACQKFVSVEERDIINYYDIKDTLVETIRYCLPGPTSYHCDSIAIPNDSIAFIRLDLDQDGQFDFDFRTFQKVDLCAPCGEGRSMETSAISIHNKASFATSGSAFFAKPFFPGDSILFNEKWGASRATLSASNRCSTSNPTFSDNLWAIKVNGRVGWIHISRTGKNGLIISEWVFNLTDARGIIAGQRS